MTTIAELTKNLKSEERRVLAKTLRLSTLDLIVRDQESVGLRDRVRFLRALADLARGRPIAQILGKIWFYNHEFVLTDQVFIPRPETELLVDQAVKRLQWARRAHRVYDIGAGSGNIILSVAALSGKYRIKHSFFGVEISRPAINVALRNASLLSISNVSFIRKDFLELDFNSKEPTLILANLPYLPKKAIAQRPSLGFEPQSALDGGENGLDLINRLLELTAKGLSTGQILIEHDPDQAKKLERLSKKLFPTKKIAFLKDLNRQTRVLKIEL